ncbi:hypothetical protein RCG24_08690 [Neobacillus sp. OS1-32]|jgi:UDP-N-acetylmuramyl pentapeptide synthase|uniref:Uncharacterized protein n=1 Tax=Neobacillus paridis TaxID=2803862 RepID=A0ABS1TQN4_9BACI|nr:MULTISPECIES: hypothetical protein [Neobacillus]MBL4952586.1 hypothetical protein [Neobacillus paridis]WML31898.1 hypothetical protein RCG24_08690 [Neobacillus sp. OS1-32]
MYLALLDLMDLFPEKHGVETNILFQTVSDQANILQPKGLFIPIPLNNQPNELSLAIENGAVAALWEQGKSLPRYTPNQFPVFFTTDLAEATRKILLRYIENLNGEIDNKMERTNFKFINKKLLNKNNKTYDIAVMLNKIAKVQAQNSERRG